MSDYTDQYQEQLKRRRRVGMVVGAAIACLAIAGVIAFVNWPPPPAPTGAEVTLKSQEGKGFTVGCPDDWKTTSMKSMGAVFCNAPGNVSTSCTVVPESLPAPMSPEDYWKQARAMSLLMGGREREARRHSVGDAVVHRIIVQEDAEARHQLFYVYTSEEVAYLVSCSAPSPRFRDLTPIFDAVAQSLRIGG